MRIVMLGDRIRNRAIEKEMVIFDSTTRWDEELRKERIAEHIRASFNLGLNF
jgi:NAD(P)H dehydrogenase (quinone)